MPAHWLLGEAGQCGRAGVDHVVPQQWLTYTSAPGVPASDRRRLDLVVYGASPHTLALCCDATLVNAALCCDATLVNAAPQG